MAEETKMVQCIEQNVYDPCDSGGGIHSYAVAQCAWAHAEIADRKIKAAEKVIIDRMTDAGAPKAVKKFVASQKKWRAFIEAYCQFTNEADATQVFDTGPSYLTLGYCLRRHKEQRAEELEGYLE